ncbi:replication initiation protein [Oceanobacillus kimchii]|uniref:replication initiation protein n=1 Tax=Oceanobacillus kimchii TaxID=746691 RepID=UPI0009859CC1|nr:replication initiation protein [Oceanobacillus kimchii]
MAEKNKKDTEEQVCQSNDLIEAIYEEGLTATKHKIIRYAVAKINKSPDHFPNISFTVLEFINAAGLSGNGYHGKIKKIVGELTQIRIKPREHKGWFPWFKEIIYKNGMVHITFNDLIKPYLICLSEQEKYTKYVFATIGHMQSPYTIRLFELLQQYATIGYRKIKLEKLKELLGVKGKYNEYGHFKSRILQSVKKELDNINVLTFTFEEIKFVRKVDEINFEIKINDDLNMEGNVKEDEIKKFFEKWEYREVKQEDLADKTVEITLRISVKDT